MKSFVMVPFALLAGGLACAQELGQVISSTPVLQQVAVPRQICTSEQVAVQQPKSGAGAVMGAVAGGALGNAVGNGGGRAAATVIGILGGAMVGDRIEGAPQGQVQNFERCTTQTFYQNRAVAYNVVYEYAGKQYSVQMPNDPGPTIQLQVTPVGMSEAPPSAPMYVQPAYVQPSYGVMVPPVYPGYYNRPYYPPAVLELNYRYRYRDGYRGRHR
jgi:uncharacterized protein YcfJ